LLKIALTKSEGSSLKLIKSTGLSLFYLTQGQGIDTKTSTETLFKAGNYL